MPKSNLDDLTPEEQRIAAQKLYNAGKLDDNGLMQVLGVIADLEERKRRKWKIANLFRGFGR